MIKSTKNQLHNVGNTYQTKAKRVLAVCSAGLLRSPTVANVLHKEFGYNTRSCGASDFALIPLSEALIVWADEIVIVDKNVVSYISDEALELMGDKITPLDISDNYDWNEKALIDMIVNQYKG